ncbi:MAG: hypothetical protein A4E55_00132 [Pelotomaculum sp. PtaU1.Bin035]|nr:MAG: hypothetical protein A4E55_00132 [Pelotomaculum sp. PtaU1.Bin035]
MPAICKASIKPEVLAAITAALAVYGYSVDQGYRISNLKKNVSPWRKAGIVEIMLGREIEPPATGR